MSEKITVSVRMFPEIDKWLSHYAVEKKCTKSKVVTDLLVNLKDGIINIENNATPPSPATVPDQYKRPYIEVKDIVQDELARIVKRTVSYDEGRIYYENGTLPDEEETRKARVQEKKTSPYYELAQEAMKEYDHSVPYSYTHPPSQDTNSISPANNEPTTTQTSQETPSPATTTDTDTTSPEIHVDTSVYVSRPADFSNYSEFEDYFHDRIYLIEDNIFDKKEKLKAYEDLGQETYKERNKFSDRGEDENEVDKFLNLMSSIASKINSLQIEIENDELDDEYLKKYGRMPNEKEREKFKWAKETMDTEFLDA